MRQRWRWPWLVVAVALGIGVWLLPSTVPLPFIRSVGYKPFGTPESEPLSSVVKDDRRPWRVDPGQPWRIEFGRGSGWKGLNTVKLDQDGRVVLHRMRWDRQGNVNVQSWETATAQLPPEAVAQVLETVAANRLLELDKAYHANMHDGTQWVLWVRQGEREKVVYFNNHFPDPIVRFAERLDGIVSASVGPGLTWRVVPDEESREHERELWDSIRR